MDFDCTQLEGALREEESLLMEAARAHAESCEACRDQLRSWDELTVAAKLLHQEWDSPELWNRINVALPAGSSRFNTGTGIRGGWRLFLSAAAVLLLTVSSLWLLRRPPTLRPITAASRQSLTEQALKEARLSEAAYVHSIDNLAKLAEPVLDQSSSPLMATYREKLTILDAAIADLNDNLERNRLNARLSAELASLYHEKQLTLQEVLRHAN